jgi:TolA-binding protein
MKNQLFFYSKLSVLVLLFACLSPMQAQKAISTQEQVIENKVRLNELEKKVAAQEQELQSALDKKQTDLEAKLELKKENLEYKKGLVGWWLTVLGILITFFGIGVPIAGFYYSRSITKDFEKQKNKTERELNMLKNAAKDDIILFIQNSKERIQLLEDKAKECISNLDNFVKHGSDAIQDIDKSLKEMDELKKNFTKKILSKDDKSESISIAKEIGNEAGKTPYERDMAKAMELYFSNDEKEALKKFFDILDTYPNEISMNNLADIYYYIAYIYYSDKQYNKSIEYYSNAIRLLPKYVDAIFNLGICYGDIPDENKAIESYKKVIEFDDKYEPAYVNLVEQLLFAKQFEDVECYLSKMNCLFEIDKFDSFWLELLHSKLSDKWDKNTNETFNDIKELVKNDSSKIEWSFDDINRWLASNKSSFITVEQRQFITELIQLIEIWRAENKKP